MLKYRGWGSHDECRIVDHHDGFTVWYETDGEVVGVLTSAPTDERYSQSRRLNIQYSPSTSSTMSDVLVTKPPTVSMPG